MKKRRFSSILLASTSVYIVIRLLMKIALVDRNYAFVFNGTDLELTLRSYDVLFTFVFFLSLYKFFKKVTMKRLTIMLAIFFVPFSIYASFIHYPLLNDDQYRIFIGTGAKHLIVIEHKGGLHPDIGDPQDIYLFEKKTSFIYKKIGQSEVRIKGGSLSNQPKLRFEMGKSIIEIEEELIPLD